MSSVDYARVYLHDPARYDAMVSAEDIDGALPALLAEARRISAMAGVDLRGSNAMCCAPTTATRASRRPPQGCGFFFGEAMVEEVRAHGWSRVPECTGVWVG